MFVKLKSESSNELIEERICGEPLQELIERSFEKPIELQEDIVVASESMDVIQEQIYVPEPPSQPQIQTEKQSKSQSEKYPKPQSEQHNKSQSEQQQHSLIDLRIPKPRAPFPTRIKVKIKNFFPFKNTV